MYETRKSQVGKYAPQWRDAIWLGKRWGTGEHIVAGDHGIVHAKSVQRRPAEEQWKRDLVEAITATPWEHSSAAHEEETEFEERDPDDCDRDQGEPEHDKREIVPRNFRIMQKDIERFGHTPNGCRKCRALRMKRSVAGLQSQDMCRTAKPR